MTATCAGCGAGIEAKAPRVALDDTDEAMAYGGTDWHPGCFAAERHDQHWSFGRPALTHPPTGRQV